MCKLGWQLWTKVFLRFFGLVTFDLRVTRGNSSQFINNLPFTISPLRNFTPCTSFCLFVTIFPIIPVEKVFLTFVANRENKIHSNSWKRKDTGREIFLQSHYVYTCAKFDATIFFLFFTNFLFKIFLLPSA